MAGRSLGGGRSEGGLDGTCRFAKYKGELGDYDLPFVRSFQLFCPIKISIFSPITAALAGLPFAVSSALPRLLPPPSASFALFPRSTLPRHPPYGGIDRAQSSVILPLLTLAHPVVQPPLSLPRSPCRPSAFHPLIRFFVSFSFRRSLSVVRFCSPLSASASTPFRSNIQLLATRTFANRSQKAGNEVAYGFCVHKCTVRFTALPPSNGATKKREIKRRTHTEQAGGRKRERGGGKGV